MLNVNENRQITGYVTTEDGKQLVNMVTSVSDSEGGYTTFSMTILDKAGYILNIDMCEKDITDFKTASFIKIRDVLGVE